MVADVDKRAYYSSKRCWQQYFIYADDNHDIFSMSCVVYVMFTFVILVISIYMEKMRTHKRKEKNECFPLMHIIHTLKKNGWRIFLYFNCGQQPVSWYSFQCKNYIIGIYIYMDKNEDALSYVGMYFFKLVIRYNYVWFLPF